MARSNFSRAQDRIVVNCGAAGLPHQAWNAALRATAAHSTVTLADTSSAAYPAAPDWRAIFWDRA